MKEGQIKKITDEVGYLAEIEHTNAKIRSLLAVRFDLLSHLYNLEGSKARKFSQDSAKLNKSPSPVAHSLSGLLHFLATNDEALERLANLDFVRNVSEFFRGGIENCITVRTDGKLCRVLPSLDNTYSLIYLPSINSNSEKSLRQIYQYARNPNPELYAPDGRFIILEVNMNAAKLGAVPLVLLSGLSVSTYGFRAEYFNPPADLIQPHIEGIIDCLQFGDVSVGESNYPITRGKIKPEIMY